MSSPDPVRLALPVDNRYAKCVCVVSRFAVSVRPVSWEKKSTLPLHRCAEYGRVCLTGRKIFDMAR